MATAEGTTAHGRTDREKAAFPGGLATPKNNNKKHVRCMKWLDKACKYGPYVKFMMDSMRKMGCEVNLDRHIVCEPCDTKVLGGFDPDRKQVVLCENVIFNQACMENVLTHELIHAYDMCRAKYEIDNIKHIACTEIRAANLSGDCFFSKETFTRFKFGWKGHQKDCVRERAIKSILCVKDIPADVATKAVDEVFDACFQDTSPFERIPP